MAAGKKPPIESRLRYFPSRYYRCAEEHSVVVLVMGVAGSGKSLVGSMLANSLRWRFADADSFHSPANVEKMSRGIPLTDVDREPWLRAMREEIATWLANGDNAVLAVSALKHRYRDRLRVGPEVKFVYLKGSPDLIQSRLEKRQGHYMKPGMLASQFADLEEPDEALVVDVNQAPEEIVEEVRQRLEV